MRSIIFGPEPGVEDGLHDQADVMGASNGTTPQRKVMERRVRNWAKSRVPMIGAPPSGSFVFCGVPAEGGLSVPRIFCIFSTTKRASRAV